MKFGVREIANVVFKATSNGKIGTMDVVAGQPVLYIDSAKTSTLEGAATTVYAQGGRGNTRLIAWEGEKTLTFTVEDALISPIGFAILSGAGLIDNSTKQYNYHMTSYAEVNTDGEIELTGKVNAVKGIELSTKAPLFVLEAKEDGSLTGAMLNIDTAKTVNQKFVKGEGEAADTLASFKLVVDKADAGKKVLVDYYIVKNSADVKELQIDAENFAGYYYVEADTLFRRQSDGADLPANITLPKVKIQSNFTFTMASTGDPSTFTFTMDAFPGYTKFDKTREVLCVIQVVNESASVDMVWNSVMDTDINNDSVVDEKDVVKLGVNSTDTDSYLNQ